MGKEETVKQELVKILPGLEGRINIARPRRIFIELPKEDFPAVFGYAAKNLGFSHLCTITGLDENENNLAAIYHLSDNSGIVLSIKIRLAKDNPALDTVTPQFPGAEIYERELADLFGIKIKGLPEGNRYPLTDDWPQGEYPLRKGWKAKEGA